MKINTHFYIFISIALIALLGDYIIYITKLPYIISLLISTSLITILDILLIKKKIFKLESNFNVYDLFFFFVLLIFIIKRIASPDYSYDVSNYHIYLQENPFIDKINFDFLAGKVYNTYLFPLGDRMYYIFRYLLGFRLGTILSYYSLTVLYYEIKRIMLLSSKNKNMISIFATLCTISSFIIRQWLGTYYIDIFAIPIILNIIYMILSYKDNKEYKRLIIILIGLLSGLLTAIKVSNLLLIIPLIIIALLYIKPNKKDIIPIIISFTCFTLSILLYCIDNYKQTGSFLFPYYNNILKSEYFGNFSWVDPRFGISGKYILIWPIYVSSIIMGYGDGWNIHDQIWAIGYIVTIITTFILLRMKKKNNFLLELCIIAIILTIIWILLLQGYMRYALVIPVLYSIIISLILINIYNRIKWKNKIKTVMIVILTGCCLGYTINYAKPYIKILSSNEKTNFSLLLKDRKNKKIHIDGVWGTISDFSSTTVLIRENNTPIYNLDLDNFNTSKRTKKMYYDKIKNNDIYIVLEDFKIDEKQKKLKENNFIIEDCLKEYTYKELPFIGIDKKVFICKLKYNKKD